MGMIAQYQRVGEAELDELLAGDPAEVFERLEELAEGDGTGENGAEDIDKYWDGLHFVLTGVPGSEPIDGDPVSEAICGIRYFDDDEDADFITYIPAAEVPRIRAALAAVDDAQIARGLDPAAMTGRVYPNIWSEDPASLVDDLRVQLQLLRDFYAAAERAGTAVAVSIL